MAVVAPTSIAAASVGGKTIHSAANVGVPSMVKDFGRIFAKTAPPAVGASDDGPRPMYWATLRHLVVDEMRRGRLESALEGRTCILRKSMAKRALAMVRGYFGMLVLGAMATDSFGSCCI